RACARCDPTGDCPMLETIARYLRAPGRAASAPAEEKASRAHSAFALYLAGEARWSARDYASFAREGFRKNPVAHRCVRLISEAAASLPLVLKEEGAERADHPLRALLARPNAREGGQRFLESVYGHLLV